ncbi:MAG: alcohol dehydrogenase catalytic domain-containing protein [Thermoanaerobaculia bacterium]
MSARTADRFPAPPAVPQTGRAMFLVGPGSLELREVAVPRPGAGELLVRIEAATTCGTDLKVFRRGGHPRMLTVPGPFGHEMTGRVVARGPTDDGAAGRGEPFEIGAPVIVANSASCGRCDSCRGGRENLCADLQYLNGAFADFLLVPERFVERSTYRRPPSLAAEIAALAEPLACVEHGLERLNLKSAQRKPLTILVLGGGPLGLLFVAALAEEGHRVTVADPHRTRLSAAKVLGAENGIEVRREAPSSAIDRAFDIAIDATGTAAGWAAVVDATLAGGSCLFFGGGAPADRVDFPSYPIHYDELSLLGCYHHTPRSFRAAIERLDRGQSDFRCLLSGELPLERLGDALQAMQERRAIKIVIR